MIGNDIVDLHYASIESNWQRKGFLNKMFTIKEQQLIFNSENPFKMVWLLWSMKESAYKIYVQQHLKRFFAPKKSVCSLTTNTTGFVVINEQQYQTKSVINDHYIYTEAVLNTSQKEVINTCFYLDDVSVQNQRNTAHKQLRTAVSKMKQLSVDSLSIKKTVAGIPQLYQKNKLLSIPFSITHHGNYGAVSILN